ncbi:MAG: NACHT domain-containing protein [Calditrichaeota bacterium]|nr:NACHT domain-containing protein [Calditrichota bacterium]MCB0269318.1 NACHT domain-containing protein [Calditrichota bacterium]
MSTFSGEDQFAQSIYAGLAKELISHLHRTVRKPFEVSEKEKAVDRCLKTATEAAILQLKPFEETDQKRLAKLLQQLFDDSDVIRELSKILIGKPLNMTELADIYMEIANHANIAGFDIEAILRVFADSFRDAAAQEKELVNLLIFGESAIQTELQTAIRDENRLQTDIQSKISDSVDKLANAKEFSRKQKIETAKKQYLERLKKLCYSLPMEPLGGDEGAKETITLEKVYIELDTTNRISALTAVGKNDRMVLLGAPGSGKSTFVKMLCGWCAANLEDEKIKQPVGFTKPLLPIYITLREIAPLLSNVAISTLSSQKRDEVLIKIFHDQLNEELKRLKATSFLRSLETALLSGDSLLVLDGFDEVPFDLRINIRSLVTAIIQQYSPKQIIVTCRTNSYTSESLPDNFNSYTLAPFDNNKIKSFITAWYQTLEKLGKVDARVTSEKIDDLYRAATTIDLIDLAKNPMLLTTMTLIHQKIPNCQKKRSNYTVKQ